MKLVGSYTINIMWVVLLLVVSTLLCSAHNIFSVRMVVLFCLIVVLMCYTEHWCLIIQDYVDLFEWCNTLPSEICSQSNGFLTSHLLNSYCRLLVLCLLDNMGVTQIARELSTYCQEDLAHEELKQIISLVVQLLTSIPDKAHARTPNALSS